MDIQSSTQIQTPINTPAEILKKGTLKLEEKHITITFAVQSQEASKIDNGNDQMTQKSLGSRNAKAISS